MNIQTPIGPLWLDANETGLTHVSFTPLDNHKTNRWTELAQEELAGYFAGTRTSFSVPLCIDSGTVFQQAVWQALIDIPYGSTCSYLDVAVAVGSPKAVRAIGQANRHNPLPIIVPCHRVIGKNGQLTGYMGKPTEEGLSIKSHLLTIEKVLLV